MEKYNFGKAMSTIEYSKREALYGFICSFDELQLRATLRAIFHGADIYTAVEIGDSFHKEKS